MRCRLLALLGYVTYCCACTYPTDLIGEWYSTSFGTLTFTNNSFSGFSSAISATPLTFTCHVTDGNRYVSTSAFNLFTGIEVQVYLCMNLRKISVIKYIYTLDSNRADGSNVRFYTSATPDVTISDACTYTDARTAGEYELLILKASIADATISCPLAFLTLYNVTMTTGSVTDCNGTALDGRTDTRLGFTYSSCATGRFSSGGQLSCLYTIDDDSYSYLNVYNNDTSVDDTRTFRFTCYVLLKINAILYATEFPRACHLSQSHVAVDSPGIQYVMLDPYYVSSEIPFDPVVVAVSCSVFGVLAILLIIALILIYVKYFRKPESPPPTPPKIRKRKRKLSVTDYLPPLSRSSSQEIPIIINRTSTEEILTGMSEHAEKKAAKLNAEGYHPPKKEAWQTKWEGGRSLSTPAVPKGPPSLRSKNLYSSTNGISEIEEMDLETSKTFSTSLPEYLDLDEYPAVKKAKPEESPTLNGVISPRYSERYHATSKMPPSTGKFGGVSKHKSTETVNQVSQDSRLDTIVENPLSRENTTTEGKSAMKRKMNSDLFPHYDRRTLVSRTTGTHSTASVGDVSFNPLSRSSYLSASNTSIFDDPTWLTENSKESEATFSLGKNLLPGFPSNLEKDQKWFMKSPQKAEFSREDIAYFKSRTTKKTGINNMVDTIGMRRSTSSLQIIQEEKRKGKDKHKKILQKEVRPRSPKFDD